MIGGRIPLAIFGPKLSFKTSAPSFNVDHQRPCNREYKFIAFAGMEEHVLFSIFFSLFPQVSCSIPIDLKDGQRSGAS